MKTSTVTIADSDTAIVTTIATRKVVIMEDPSVSDWPTTDYTIKAPTTSDDAVQKPAGVAHVFEFDHIVPVGKTIGHVAIITGSSTTFQQIEYTI